MALEHRPAPRKARVRVAEPDLATLKEKHSLKIIGRVTNPSMQKVGSLISFFTEHWKADIPPVGSDLGLGMFQFQFELESDLLTVLEKQPYHFARWMVILQRWEPTVSPDFPSMIPFWIRVQGIPVHLWTEETIQTLGEDIGTFEMAEVTSTAARMRVHINGRLPLIKQSVIEYGNGDEVMATLVYERLERHCSVCHRLDHEVRDCLEAKHQKKALLAAQNEILKKQGAHDSTSRKSFEANSHTHYRDVDSHRREDDSRRPQYGSLSRFSTDKPSAGLPSHRPVRNEPYLRDRFRQRQEWQPRGYRSREFSRDGSSLRNSGSFRGDSHRGREPAERQSHRVTDREEGMRTPISPNNPRTSPQEFSSFSRNKNLPLERGIPLPMCNSGSKLGAVETALETIKDTMNLYTNCADPAETAARRERVKRAEEQGVLEKNAERMALLKSARENFYESPLETDVEMQRSQERTPTSERLGPLNVARSPQDRLPLSARLGPLNGDEPETGVPLAITEDIETVRIPVSERIGQISVRTNEGTTIDSEVALVPKKRKPGRPPGIRQGPTSTEQAPAMASTFRKRKSAQEKPPTGKKKTGLEVVRPRKVTKTTKNRRGTPRSTPTSNTVTSSDNLPLANLIPPTARRRMDFRGPSNPVP